MVQESTKSRARRKKSAQKTKERIATERAKRVQPVRGKKAPVTKATAADRAKFAPGRGGLGALSRKVKSERVAKKGAKAVKKRAVAHDYSKGPRKSKKYGIGWGIKPKG